MKILVLGSGLLGVTTAYELGRRGFEVTVLERQSESGAETSYANGGQLSYSHAEPWASPGALPNMAKWIFKSDAPLVFRPRADWQMIRWGLKFLRNCTPARANANCVNLLRLGLYSREKMGLLRQETGIDFDYNEPGILHIYGTQKDYDAARKQSEFQAKFGCNERELTKEECLAMEPALSQTDRTIVGGIVAPDDQCGDAYLFCKALADLAVQRHGVSFKYGVHVQSLNGENGTIAGVETDQGRMQADGYVIAAGSYSPLLLRPLGIDVPIYPMKGYSITLPANDACPSMSITDGTHKIVFSRLGNRMRVAGTAEFAGYNREVSEKRIVPIMAAARRLFPAAPWEHEIAKWACLRPSTPDGPPIIGLTPWRNLFLNTGHGTLGWTQAAGSAAIVADIMEGKPPEIMLHGLTMQRYLA